jgi:hypothetical protein
MNRQMAFSEFYDLAGQCNIDSSVAEPEPQKETATFSSLEPELHQNVSMFHRWSRNCIKMYQCLNNILYKPKYWTQSQNKHHQLTFPEPEPHQKKDAVPQHRLTVLLAVPSCTRTYRRIKNTVDKRSTK